MNKVDPEKLLDLVKDIEERLKKINPHPDTHMVRRISHRTNTAHNLTYVRKDAPERDDVRFPWESRYLFITSSGEDHLSINVYYFEKPQPMPADPDVIHWQGKFSNTDIGRTYLFDTAVEHLIMGVLPPAEKIQAQ